VDQQHLAKLTIDRTDKPQVGHRVQRRKKNLLGILFWTLLAGGGLVAYHQLKPAGTEVKVGTVSSIYPSQAFTLLSGTGYVVPQTKADVASKATGRLEKLEVEEGSQVKKGQILARLENRDVEASLNQAKANLEAATTELLKSQAELKESALALQRAQTLLNRKFVSREYYDAAVARHDKAKAAVANGKALIAAADAVRRGAQVALDYTLIRAPFDGVILSKHADIGDILAPFSSTVQSKGAVVSMADLNTLQVEADVSESNLMKVRLEQPCEIQLDAIPDERFRCIVHSVVPTVDRSKATVLVKTRFIDQDSRILPDMSAKVSFLSQTLTPEQQHPVTAIPPTALIKRDGSDRVYRIDGAHVTETPVEIKGQLGEFLVIGEKGLKPGDQIVLHPPGELRDGAEVRLPKS
jgi:RND family efflux transporter MFP subunit